MKKLKLGKKTIMNLTQIQADQVKGGKINMDNKVLWTFQGRCTDGCTDGCPTFTQTAWNCTEYRCTFDC